MIMSGTDKQAPGAQVSYTKYIFRDRSEYIVAPWISGATHQFVSIRHGAAASPWVDRDVHLHSASEEYYFLFQGELQLLVDGSVYTLKPYEVLKVRPQVPHAVVGSKGPIEHFVIRMPAPEDRQTVGLVASGPWTVSEEARRELRADWGCRIPLAEERNQNCWLFGVGQARFHSEIMCLAYLNFPDVGSVKADKHQHRLHLHEESWEYYTVLQGTRILQVDEELVAIEEGEILAVPPGVKHVLQATNTPFEAITFRVPRLDDKVEF